MADHLGAESTMKRKLFKVGDKVKLNGCPFDEQIPEEVMEYAKVASKTMVVKRVSKKTDMDAPWSGEDEQDPDGTFIKTNLMSDWTSAAWFKLAKKKAPRRPRPAKPLSGLCDGGVPGCTCNQSSFEGC